MSSRKLGCLLLGTIGNTSTKKTLRKLLARLVRRKSTKVNLLPSVTITRGSLQQRWSIRRNFFNDIHTPPVAVFTHAFFPNYSTKFMLSCNNQAPQYLYPSARVPGLSFQSLPFQREIKSGGFITRPYEQIISNTEV